MSLCAIAVYLSSSSDAHVVKAIVTLLILHCWIVLIAFYLRCAKGPQRVFTDYLHKALFISAEWWLTGNWETEVWHMARWAAFNILLISPSRWSTIISMHFIVGTREKDRQVQFRFIARLLIDCPQTTHCVPAAAGFITRLPSHQGHVLSSTWVSCMGFLGSIMKGFH